MAEQKTHRRIKKIVSYEPILSQVFSSIGKTPSRVKGRRHRRSRPITSWEDLHTKCDTNIDTHAIVESRQDSSLETRHTPMSPPHRPLNSRGHHPSQRPTHSQSQGTRFTDLPLSTLRLHAMNTSPHVKRSKEVLEKVNCEHCELDMPSLNQLPRSRSIPEFIKIPLEVEANDKSPRSTFEMPYPYMMEECEESVRRVTI